MLLAVTAVLATVTAPVVIAAVVPVIEAAPLDADRSNFVPTVSVVPDAKVVVVVKDPGAVIAAGRDTVATPATVVTVTCAAVPLIAVIAPESLANSTQFPPPA